MQVPPVGYAAYHIKRAEQPAEALQQADCIDKQAICAKWASDGECGRNPAFMHLECSQSCAKCQTSGEALRAAATARSVPCSTSPVAAGSMRCQITEEYREDVTYYNVTTSVFNNGTNTTDVLVTTQQNTSTVLDRTTVRNPSKPHDCSIRPCSAISCVDTERKMGLRLWQMHMLRRC